MHLDKQHPVPVYLQLKEMLQNKIEQGTYFSHQKLPSERDLCQHYNLSRMTARRALKELIAEGFAYTRIGKGTFVSYNPNSSAKMSSTQPDQSRPLDLADSGAGLSCKQKLIDQLLSFNSVGVERVISEALAVYSLETVAVQIFPEVIRRLAQQWQKGEINLSAQNYAINVLHSQLVAMVNATAIGEAGPKVLLACAPEDQHEIGLLLLALNLRRRGFQVIYLGLNVVAAEFYQVIKFIQPQLVCFSAATTQAVETLAVLSQQYQTKLLSPRDSSKPGKQEVPLTFGGVAFSQNPSLRSKISGLYLGHTVEAALTKIQELLPL